MVAKSVWDSAKISWYLDTPNFGFFDILDSWTYWIPKDTFESSNHEVNVSRAENGLGMNRILVYPYLYPYF